MKKVTKEWYITVPWGKIALISWGEPTGEPVLMVHGRQDSAATFVPLVELLPDKYYFVAIDLPGHGKSDPFPISVAIQRFHFVCVVELVLEQLKWDNFVYVGHSMGCEQGLFYNIVYPKRIKKFVFLDPGPSLQRLQVHDYHEYVDKYFTKYYSNYDKYNIDDRVYTKERAVNSVMRVREIDEEKAKLILSRNLKSIGDGKYKLSWDKRLKMPVPQNFPPEYYYELFSKNAPPTLIFSATDTNGIIERKEKVEKLINRLQNNLKHYYVEVIKGNHDIHVISPEKLAPSFLKFLETDFGNVKSKL